MNVSDAKWVYGPVRFLFYSCRLLCVRWGYDLRKQILLGSSTFTHCSQDAPSTPKLVPDCDNAMVSDGAGYVVLVLEWVFNSKQIPVFDLFL